MKVVIAERDSEIRGAIEKILKKADRECEIMGAADNGREGYLLVRTMLPDLLIMDIDLHGMNGLSMLRKLRKEQIGCRVIILTGSEAFGDARQAITLETDSYLLKPLKERQLRNAVARIKEKVAKERQIESIFTVDNLFRACLNGRLIIDRELHELTKERFGFSFNDKSAVFTVWMGQGYEEQKQEAKRLLEGAVSAAKGFSAYVINADVWKLLLVVIYRIEENAEADMYFQRKAVPVLCSSLKGVVTCIWADMEHLADMPETLKKIREMKEWNLLFDRGEMIRQEKVGEIKPVPLKYPAEIENQVRKAVIAGEPDEIRKCYYRLYNTFREQPHSPREMKECLIRFNMAVVNVYKTQREVSSELQIQKSMRKIEAAASWIQIREAMEGFFETVSFETLSGKGNIQLSPLVLKAVQIAKKYYEQGITLEEVADRLFVSEEYLSSRFKKETGMGFTETVRKYRIERIKELLVSTRLKVNQIAELVGYTDPKYMSKVFKEETGMLPTEFRKMIH